MTYISTLSNIDKQTNKQTNKKESSQTFNNMNGITDHFFFDLFCIYCKNFNIY